MLERLATLDIHPVRLPVEADRDPTIKHVQVLASGNLATARRILLVAPDAEGTVLGMHSLRYTTDVHIGNGSMETIARRALQEEGYDAFIAANPAALYWDANKCVAIASAGWKAGNLPTARLSLHSSSPLSGIIPGHESPEQHLASLLDYLKSRITSNPDALDNPDNHDKVKVDFVATGYSAYALLLHLNNEYSFWRTHVHAGVLAASGHSFTDCNDLRFREFMRLRCRNYTLSSEPAGNASSQPSLVIGMASFSSGHPEFAANIVPTITSHIFAYFRKAYRLDAPRTPGTAPVSAGGDNDFGDEEEDELNPPVPIMLGDAATAQNDLKSALNTTLHARQQDGPPAATAAADDGWQVPS